MSAFVYKWTHIPSMKWYVGSRTAKNCHINDGYLCSSKLVKQLILANPTEWKREIISEGSPEEMLNLETTILQTVDAKNDIRSFNNHNNDGIFVNVGDKNPMRIPEIARKNHEQTKGDKHWTRNLNGKPHPQKGQKRPSITGDNHPNKNPINANKISKSHKGKKHEYQRGDKNVMRRPEVKEKLSGENHWAKKEENKKQCKHCSMVVSKSNYTRWHGSKCRKLSFK